MLPGVVDSAVPARLRILDVVARKQGTLLLHVADRQSGIEGALKLFDLRTAANPAVRAGYPRELELLRSLGNPGILPVWECGEETPGWFYILMPWMAGGSLGQKLRRDGPLSLAMLDCVLQPVSAALDAAHALGICHLDIHPENILFDEEGRAFLSDFGMPGFARAWVGEDAPAWTFGPAASLPPELAIPGGEPGPHSDIYMLGALAFEALSGSPPYPAQTPQGSILQHLMAPLPRLAVHAGAPDRPEWEGLDAVLQVALSKDPHLRFERAGEMLNALLAAEGLVAPVQAPAGTIFTLAGRPPTRTQAGGSLTMVDWNPPAPPPPVDEPVALEIGPAFDAPPPPASARPRRAWLRSLAGALLMLLVLAGWLLGFNQLMPGRADQLLRGVWPEGFAALQAAGYVAAAPSPTASGPAPATPTRTAALAAINTPAATATLETANPTTEPSPGPAGPTDTPLPTLPPPTPTITLPPPTSPTTYTIAYNDTLFTIASQFYVRLDELAAVNNLYCDSKLPPSTQMVIPPSYGFNYTPAGPGYQLTTATMSSIKFIHQLDCTANVKAMDVSPDGRTLAVASGNYIYLWEVGSWKPLARLKGHQAVVDNLRFSPDSTRLASSSEDRTIRLWDPATGAELVKMGGHTNTITALVFSPGGQMLVSASRDQSVRFWQVDGTFLKAIRGYPAFSAAFSPDGQTLAVGFTDLIRLYRVDDLQEIAAYPTLDVVHHLAFSPSGLLLAAPSEVWSIPLGQRVHELKRRGDGVAFSLDGRLLLVGRRFFRVADGDPVYQLKMPVEEAPRAGDIFDEIVLSPDGSLLFWGAPDGLFVFGFTEKPLAEPANGALYTVQDGDTLFNIANTHNKTLGGLLRANSLTCSNLVFPSQELIIPPGDGLADLMNRRAAPIALANVSRLQNTGSLANDCLLTPGSLTFSTDSQYLASGSGVWNLATGALVLQVSDPPRATSGGYDQNLPSPLAAFAPDAPQAAVRNGTRIELWDLLTGRLQRTLLGHTDNVTSLAYSPDGSQLISSANIRDKDIILWDLANGSQSQTLSGWSAYDLRLTPDGLRLLANSADTMRFWDLQSGRMIKGLTGLGEYALSPLGETLAYVGCLTPGAGRCKQEVVILYDIAGQKTFQTLSPAAEWVTSLAYAPNGQYVAATSGNTAIVWNAADGSEKVRLGDASLTAAMAKFYFVPASQEAGLELALTITQDGRAWFWNLNTGALVHQMNFPHDRLAFTPDGRAMIVLYNGSYTVYQVP